MLCLRWISPRGEFYCILIHHKILFSLKFAAPSFILGAGNQLGRNSAHHNVRMENAQMEWNGIDEQNNPTIKSNQINDIFNQSNCPRIKHILFPKLNNYSI